MLDFGKPIVISKLVYIFFGSFLAWNSSFLFFLAVGFFAYWLVGFMSWLVDAGGICLRIWDFELRFWSFLFPFFWPHSWLLGFLIAPHGLWMHVHSAFLLLGLQLRVWNSYFRFFCVVGLLACWLQAYFLAEIAYLLQRLLSHDCWTSLLQRLHNHFVTSLRSNSHTMSYWTLSGLFIRNIGSKRALMKVSYSI